MKKLLIAVLALVSLSASANVALPGTNNTVLNAQIITDILADAKTPADVKAILGTIINGQKGDEVVSILGIEKKRNNVRLEVVIQIGVDNVTDDDSGWGSVLEVRAIFNSEDARSRDGVYKLGSVELVPVAG